MLRSLAVEEQLGAAKLFIQRKLVLTNCYIPTPVIGLSGHRNLHLIPTQTIRRSQLLVN